MRSRVKYTILFISLLAFTLATFKYNLYNLFAIERSESSWKLSIGPSITLSLQRSSRKLNNTLKRRFSSGNASPVKILLWSKLYSKFAPEFNENDMFPSYGQPKFSCPVAYSFVTDRNEIDSSSGVIVHIKENEDIPSKRGNRAFILQYDEPPTKYNKLSKDAFMNKFNYAISYRLDSDFPNPRIRRPEITTPLDFNQKHDYVAAVFSHCNKIRTEYAREMSKFLRIKSFGVCLRNVEKNNVARVHEVNYIQSKIRRISMFKFSLVFMKYDCEDFIDEQLNHAWSAGTLPIFLGTDTLEEILPNYLKSSFVSVSNFRRPIDLADYFESLTNDRNRYERYMSWRAKKIDSENENRLWAIWNPDYSLGCQIAMKLAEDRASDMPKKTLKSFQCTERDINTWLDKKVQADKSSGKIVND